MSNMKVFPKQLKGSVKIPSSKSLAHRAVICAALSDGNSKITNIDISDDIIATINAMRSLGAVINNEENVLEVEGVFSKNLLTKREYERVIDCNESGSTLRFLVPITLAFEGINRFVGRGNLGKRPLNPYYNIFDTQGIDYTFCEDELNLVTSGLLKSGEFKLEGNISSQFISGLMFTLPLLEGDSKIIITTEIESKGYIDLTLSVLKDFGISIINDNYREFIIKGGQRYKSREYRVEGDYSQGAFFLCADMLGSKVNVLDLKEDSLQGDREIINVLKKMGAEIDKNLNINLDTVKSTVIDASQCPDIVPILSLVASVADGTTEIINAGRLRIKECDRLTAVTTELNKLGANIEEKKDGLIIKGVKHLKGDAEVWSHKDHRIAMTLAIAATICEKPIIIKDYECVSKSYPRFFDDFKTLGGECNEWSMGE